MTDMFPDRQILGQGARCFLLLHGWGRDLRYLRPMAKLLAKHGVVHIITMPGFGKTPPPPGAWGSGEYADFIARYMEEEKIAPAVVVGHSFGGKVALQLAANHSSLVSALVLIGSSGLPRKRTRTNRIRFSWIKFLRKWATRSDALFGTNLRKTHELAYASLDYRAASPEMRQVLVRTVNEDLSTVAGGVAHPALLLWGEADTETPVDMGIRFSQLLSNSQLTVMQGKDHTPFEMLPDLCVAYITQFVQNLPSEQASMKNADGATNATESDPAGMIHHA